MFRQRMTILSGLVVLGLSSAVFSQQTMELTGTLRDFSVNHSDFENDQVSSYPLITGMVRSQLGADDNPVLNLDTVTNADDPLSDAIITVTFNPAPHAESVYVTSTKDLSNVVLKLSNDVEYKYDSLNVGQSATFTVPEMYSGETIEGVWVKSGANASGDGSGYGEYLWISADGNSGDYVVDPMWRIESENSFNQWFNNIESVNESTKHTITLEDTNGDGIFRYEASKHNGQSFFPLDDRLLGNEGLTHNYHFTYEIHTKFTYTDPASRDQDLVFSFSGDDDVWVFINKQLVVDLGGVHSEKSGSVNVDTIADQLGLEPGETYDLDFFFAERHTTESNFTIETTIQLLSPLYD
jgi:fibro-slime domain-containing protein